MRKLAIFLIAIALLVGGSWLLFEELTAATIIYGRAIFGGSAFIAVGFMLLWEDFVSPMVRGTRKDKA